jgi:glutamate synthase domain-containing protein 3
MDTRDGNVLAVNEIRDYVRINAQVAQALDAGRTHVRLAGVDGQRLLASGLGGDWSAVVEIEGQAGPELAAELNAPGLIVVCRGSAADGAGRGLRQGHLLVLGDAGDATAYRQAGGIVVVCGATGHRAGLELAGGTLILGGPPGRLLGDRQNAGRILVLGSSVGPHFGHARRGGRLVAPRLLGPAFDRPSPEDGIAYLEAVQIITPWLPPDWAGPAAWPGSLVE